MDTTNVTYPTSLSLDAGGNFVAPIRTQKTIYAPIVPNAVNGQEITAALASAYKDYVKIRIQGRGGSAAGIFDATKSLVFNFLINPKEVSVSRSTMVEKGYTRGGWQIGLQGEDFTTVTLSGKTPGQYYDSRQQIQRTTTDVVGLVDTHQQFSLSYRNMLALEALFENNGYWFEGEQVYTKTAASNRQIKMHQDVELTVGEFIWKGMFESMDISQDANNPYLQDFSLSFLAWQENFDTRTPYPNSIGGEVQRGHVPVSGVVQQDAVNANAAQSQVATPSGSNSNISTSSSIITSTIVTPATPASASSPTVISSWLESN